MKRAFEAINGPTCPCCANRLVSTQPYKPSAEGVDAAAGLCEICVDLDSWAGELPPFQWPTTVAEIKASTAKVLADAEANLAAVAAVDHPTFATVIRPLMLSPNFKTNVLVCQSKFVQHGSTDAALRDAAEEAGKNFAAFKASARTRADVFSKVQAFAATAEAKALGPYEAHFLDAVLSDFTRGGLALSPTERSELQRLLDADAAACAAYGSNLGNDKTRLVVDPSELEGLPEAFLKERTGEDGKVTLTLKYPDIIPVFGQCAVEATRKALMQARESAYADNLELMAKGVNLRKQTAALLGYRSWAHFVIERRMAGTPETVVSFLEKIRSLATDGAAADLESLRQAKLAHLTQRGELPASGAESVKLEAWDTAFYHDRILRRDFGVDTEAVRAYFPLDHVVATTMDIYQELLGLSFTEVPSGAFSRWHEDVRLFVVHDAPDTAGDGRGRAAGGGAGGGGALVGHFYLDLHPREGKYGHAAIFHLLKRNGDQKPCDAMMCNLPARSKDGTPALLRHDDVVTFFHEVTQQRRVSNRSASRPPLRCHSSAAPLPLLCRSADASLRRLLSCSLPLCSLPAPLLCRSLLFCALLCSPPLLHPPPVLLFSAPPPLR
jgi:Zn-dependent oligopeptidase